MPYHVPLVAGCAGKAERLRQAKAEAEKEISAYRAEREGAYQKKLAEVCLAASAPVATNAHSTPKQCVLQRQLLVMHVGLKAAVAV
jgi:hypothetical protein